MSLDRAPYKTRADHPIVQVSPDNVPSLVILLPPQAFPPDSHQRPFWLEGPLPVVAHALHAAHDCPHAKGRSRSTPKSCKAVWEGTVPWSTAATIRRGATSTWRQHISWPGLTVAHLSR
jgi:hypothetical protein